MNETTNIPAILRGKPQGTKLHDLVRGTDVFLNNVVDGCDKVCCTFVKNGSQKLHYSPKGTLVGFEDGMVILVPSKLMRDWSKFAWKKGDILVSKHGTTEVVFDCFDNDTYETFKGKHALKTIEGEAEYKGESDDGYDFYTENYYLESEDAALNYIHIIEKILGGKLNLKTLEIEKQPEFKDGDIVVTDAVPSMWYSKCIFILKGDLNTGESRANSYVFFNINNNHISYDVLDTIERDRNIHLATDSEKQQLFDAIKKDGKAWDAEKKQVVRLQVSGKLYYFEMENELAYIAKLKEAKGGKYTFESNVSWCPRNSTNGYDYEEGSFIVSDKDCYGFREANAGECKIFEKFLVEHAMESFKFKTLDYVLAKNITCYESNAWNLFQYAYRNKDGAHIMVGGGAFLQCIPYVGNEDLLGTTKLYSTKK